MSERSYRFKVQVDDSGRLILPPELARQLGLLPGAETEIDLTDNTAILHRPITHLAKIYLEPTNQCNLVCQTCMRNVWDEPSGMMSPATIQQIITGLKAFDPVPDIFIGGFGEPLFHPEIIPLLTALRDAGAELELITNGILLTEEISRQLVRLGLKRLWVSLDGATPESYSDVRLGASLPLVLQNLQQLVNIRNSANQSAPELGIAFVAMQSNLDQLPHLLQIGKELGVTRYSITNVVAHTPQLRQGVLYEESLYHPKDENPARRPIVRLPRLDFDPESLAALSDIFQPGFDPRFGDFSLSQIMDSCPFTTRGSLSIRWDGAVSPCLPLLHTFDSYLDQRKRRSRAFLVGNLADHTLAEIWSDTAYSKLRLNLRSFDFSPCTYCNSCEMSEDNQVDCYGNTAPACGGCLWAQGLVQCP
jgi:MoaA/NifB/PqqE/SkfB family radical SAM enzyme